MTDQLLANMATGDGNHDFDSLGPGSDAAAKATFAESVLIPPTGQPNEAACLNNIERDPAAGTTLKGRLLAAADGAVVEFTTKTGFNFFAKTVILPADVGKNPGEDGATLAGRLGIDKTILIVDTSQHEFLARLKYGPANPAIHVQYAYTPETENDPASKTSVYDPVFTTAGGIQVTSHLQADGPMIYTGNLPYNAATPGSNFFSKYTFTLSALQHIGFVKRIWKRSVNVAVTSDTGGKVQESPDAKTSNSIARLLTLFLAKAFAKLTKGPTPTDKFNVNAAWARKRGGDWFQALCCQTLHGHTFNPPIDSSFTATFSTLDYIALSYALLMGVDTLFFPATDKATGIRKVFLITKQRPAAYDPVEAAAARDAACGDRLLAAGYRASFVPVLAMLGRHDDIIRAAKDDWLGQIDALAIEPTAAYVREVLTKALHYAHISFETEADEILTRLAPLVDWINTGVNPPTDSFCQHEETLRIAKKLHDKHGGIPGMPANFIAAFKNRDEFRSLDEWAKTLVDKTLTRRIQAIAARVATAVVSAKPATKKDAFLFLAYIARVDKSSPVRVLLLEKFARLGEVSAELPASNLKTGIDVIVNAVTMYMSVPDGPDTAFTLSGESSLAEVVGGIQEDESVHNELDSEEGEVAGGGKRGGWRPESRPATAGLFPNTHALWPVLAGHIAFAGVPPSAAARAAIQFDLSNNGEMIPHPQRGGAQSQEDLLPVYAMLEALSTQVSPELDNSLDIHLYERLFAFLKLASKKEGLGYALREVLFTMVRTSTGRPIVEKALGSSMAFSMLCTSLSEYLCGEFQGLDEAPGIALLSTPETMKTLQEMYTEASEQSNSFTLKDVLELKASIAKEIMKETTEVLVVETVTPTEAWVPHPPSEPPPADLLKDWKPQPPTELPPAAIGARRRRTRRTTQSFLPHRRQRSHRHI